MAHLEVTIDQLHHEIQEIKSLLQKQTDTNSLRAPKIIFVDNLRSDGYRLSHAFPVTVEYEEDTVIASFYDLDLYGLGDEVSEAIDDLCATLIEYYEMLREDRNCLGPLARKHWQYLQTLVTPVTQNANKV